MKLPIGLPYDATPFYNAGHADYILERFRQPRDRRGPRPFGDEAARAAYMDGWNNSQQNEREWNEARAKGLI